MTSFYVSNYARDYVRDELLRINGVGDLIIFGERQYSLRVWLDPEKLATFGLTSSDVVKAIQEQNVQVSGGALGQEPVPETKCLPDHRHHPRSARRPQTIPRDHRSIHV